MWDPCPSCWVVMYIDVAEASNYSRFNSRAPFHSGWMCNIHAMPLSLYPLIPYFQVLGHSVTVGILKTMLFVGNPLVVTHWRIFIQS